MKFTLMLRKSDSSPEMLYEGKTIKDAIKRAQYEMQMDKTILYVSIFIDSKTLIDVYE